MKIAIVADPMIPVPPTFYGGIERIIDMLIKGLISNGVEVSLFAHRNSETDAILYPYLTDNNNGINGLKNALLINKVLLQNKHDLIHSFGRLAYLLPQLPLGIPKLMSYQREPTLSQIKKAFKLSKKHTLFFTGCSNYISDQIKPYVPTYTVYNGVDLGDYHFCNDVKADNPLVFLGRIEPIKGTHIAIEIAKKTNKKLLIAGNVPSEYLGYFESEVKPYLNEQIVYIGPVNDTQKNELLGNALALLMPIQWNEPFGIVMAEAMACGTPVIGFRKGSVSEVVQHGVNGFICDHIDQMVEAVAQIEHINRKDVRKICEVRFSAKTIVESYLDVYQKISTIN